MQINILNDGTKVYGAVVKGLSRPTPKNKAEKDSKPRKEYSFNEMQDNDCFFVENSAGRAAAVQAFQSQKYEPARKRGKLVTCSVKKLSKEVQEQIGNPEAVAIFFQAFTADELAAMKVAEASKEGKGE